MFASPAYASSGPMSSGMAGIIGLAPWLLIILIMYMLLLRPQQQAVKRLRAKIAAVKKNDVAVTSGGLIGKVVRVDEAEVELEIASGVKVKVVKTMLSDVRPFGAKPAND